MNTKVCIARDDRYDDSMGAYSIFYFWDGVEVSRDGSMYSGYSYNKWTVDATIDQIREASIYIEEHTEEGYNYNKYAGCNTYVGCVVKLSRSRKAPNNKELKVTHYNDGTNYSSYYGHAISDSIDLVDPQTNITYENISLNCIKEVVKGVKELPFWHISEQEYNKRKTDEDNTKLVNEKIIYFKTEIESLLNAQNTLVAEFTAKYTPNNKPSEQAVLDLTNKIKSYAEKINALSDARKEFLDSPLYRQYA